jgi:hypothetical protein
MCRLMKTLFLVPALLVMVPMSAAAQDVMPGKFGVGLSFLGDEGGTGFTVDYSKPFRSVGNDRTLGWVGDFSFHRNGFDDFGLEGDFTSFTFQGGVRISGPIGTNSNLTWHGQGLVGVLHHSFDVGIEDDLDEDACEDLGLDCSFGESDTGFIFTPGVGIDFWFNERTALRGQFDIPIGEGGSTTRFWVGISRRIGTGQ